MIFVHSLCNRREYLSTKQNLSVEMEKKDKDERSSFSRIRRKASEWSTEKAKPADGRDQHKRRHDFGRPARQRGNYKAKAKS